MRKYILLTLMSFVIYQLNAQTVKLKIYGQATKFQNAQTGKWSDFIYNDDKSGLVLIDAGNNRIKIYSDASEIIYDLIEYKGQYKNEEDDLVTQWIGIDYKGDKCGIKLVAVGDQEDRLFINFGNMIVVWRLRFLEAYE